MSRGLPEVTRERVRAFMSSFTIDATSNCWLWDRAINDHGYAVFQGASASRVSFAWFRRDIPERFDVDHLCRNTRCVNPDHLEPVTRSENLLRASPYRKTVLTCRRGHEMKPENTKVWGAGNGRTARYCFACVLLRRERQKDRQHAA